MAEPPGTWVKLGRQERQYIPPSVRDNAYKHGMTWDATVEMTKSLRTEGLDDYIVMSLGKYMSKHAHQQKMVAETEGKFVQLTPRSAKTEMVPPSIKQKDGHNMPAGSKSVPPPPPAAAAGYGTKDMFPPPGNFKDRGEIEAPPGQFGMASSSSALQTYINHGVGLLPSNHAEEEEEESQSSKSTPGVNTWWTAEDIKKYLKEEYPGAVVWKPWNAYIFDGITDFVSTLRTEAAMPGAHLKWPEQSMTYEMAIAQVPPGFHVSIKNGNPCPKKLLISTESWPGEVAQYYHGTTAHNLLRGIIRDGLKPMFGSGGDTTARAWGQNTPMVYLSNLLECACFYPNHDTTYAAGPYKNYGRPWGGEIISRDGTPPIRVVLRCILMNTRQLWHKHKKGNDQRGFMPKHVYISHIIFYALPPYMASGMHSHTTWKMYTSAGHQATTDNLKMDESSSNVDTRNEKNHWLVHETYGIGKMMPKPVTVDITKKDMLATRMNHR